MEQPDLMARNSHARVRSQNLRHRYRLFSPLPSFRLLAAHDFRDGRDADLRATRPSDAPTHPPVDVSSQRASDRVDDFGEGSRRVRAPFSERFVPKRIRLRKAPGSLLQHERSDILPSGALSLSRLEGRDGALDRVLPIRRDRRPLPLRRDDRRPHRSAI